MLLQVTVVATSWEKSPHVPQGTKVRRAGAPLRLRFLWWGDAGCGDVLPLTARTRGGPAVTALAPRRSSFRNMA